MTPLCTASYAGGVKHSFTIEAPHPEDDGADAVYVCPIRVTDDTRGTVFELAAYGVDAMQSLLFALTQVGAELRSMSRHGTKSSDAVDPPRSAGVMELVPVAVSHNQIQGDFSVHPGDWEVNPDANNTIQPPTPMLSLRSYSLANRENVAVTVEISTAVRSHGHNRYSYSARVSGAHPFSAVITGYGNNPYEALGVTLAATGTHLTTTDHTSELRLYGGEDLHLIEFRTSSDKTCRIVGDIYFPPNILTSPDASHNIQK